MHLAVSFDNRFASCLPLTMELAHLAHSVIRRHLPRGRRTWPYEDRVLAWLAPEMRDDVAAFHQGEGDELVARLSEDR